MTLDEFRAEWQNADDRLLVHTSGSTGRPKPLWVEKKRMEASARMTCDFLQLQPGQTALLCLPLDYIAGKMLAVRAWVAGLVLRSVTPNQHEVLPEGPIDLAALVPSQVYACLQQPQQCERLRAIRHLLIGGGAVSAEVEQQLRTFPNAVWSTYGMTETLSHIALRRMNGPEASPWYTPFEGVQLQADTNGCLVIQAPAVCAEILYTHDIVEFHPDGRRFRIRGRMDNVICSGGIKLQIEEIEEQLRKHLSVPFLISKRPDAQYGEVVVLLVQKPVSAHQVQSAVEQLPRYSKPKQVVEVTQLPLTRTGKPDRAKALQLAAGL